MSAKKMGLGGNHPLGRGLQALGLKERHDEEKGTVIELDLTAIVPNPRQPRQSFPPESLQDLADSIRQHGVIQPVIVQKKDVVYELVAGERRFQAARLCGLQTIPALVREYSEQAAAEIALIENLQREDLNAIEEGAAYAALMQAYGLTQEQAAAKVGKSRSHVANMIRLLQLPEEIRQYVIDGALTMGQARPLLQLPKREMQLEAAMTVIDRDLSARQAEGLVRSLLAEKKPQPDAPQPDAHLEAVEDRIKMRLGTSVAIRLGKNKKKGRIEISFASEEELERLLAILADEPDRMDEQAVSSFHV